MNTLSVSAPAKRRKWTDDDLRSEARKYETRVDFARNSRRAYRRAWDRGILDEICAHMQAKPRRWTDEELTAEALKYRTRADFAKNAWSAYNVAQRRGLLKKVCRHMKTGRRPCPSDNDAVYLWRVPNTAIYKIGVTSTRLAQLRIQQVSFDIRVQPELIVYTTCEDARAVEREVLQLGMPYAFERSFSGSTEFRWMCPEELAQAVDIIASNSWLN